MIIATPTLEGLGATPELPSTTRRIAAYILVARRAGSADPTTDTSLISSANICTEQCSLADIAAAKTLADQIGTSSPIISGLSYDIVESFKSGIIYEKSIGHQDADIIKSYIEEPGPLTYKNVSDSSPWLLYAYIAEAFRQVDAGYSYGQSEDGIYDNEGNTIQSEVAGESVLVASTVSTTSIDTSSSAPSQSFYQRNKKLIWIVGGIAGVAIVGGAIYFSRRRRKG